MATEYKSEPESITLDLKTIMEFLDHLYKNDSQRPCWFDFSRVLPLQDGGPFKYLMKFNIIGTQPDTNTRMGEMQSRDPLDSLQRGHPWPSYQLDFDDTLALLHIYMLREPLVDDDRDKLYYRDTSWLVQYTAVLDEADALEFGMPKSLLDPEKTPKGSARASSFCVYASFHYPKRNVNSANQ